MAESLNPKAAALSLAGVSGTGYVICAALFAAAPQQTLGFFNEMFHGIDLTRIARENMTFGGTLVGFAGVVVLSLAAGWLFATAYNYLSDKFR